MRDRSRPFDFLTLLFLLITLGSLVSSVRANAETSGISTTAELPTVHSVGAAWLSKNTTFQDPGTHYTGKGKPNGTVSVFNNCPVDYFISHVKGHSNGEGPMLSLPANSHLTWPMIIPEINCECGVSLKVYHENSSAGPHVQFEYNFDAFNHDDPSRWAPWYDISLIDCKTETKADTPDYDLSQCPGWDGGLKVDGYNTQKNEWCPSLYSCGMNRFCPYDAYIIPSYKDEPNIVCRGNHVDLRFIMCSGHTINGKDKKPPHDYGPGVVRNQVTGDLEPNVTTDLFFTMDPQGTVLDDFGIVVGTTTVDVFETAGAFRRIDNGEAIPPNEIFVNGAEETSQALPESVARNDHPPSQE